MKNPTSVTSPILKKLIVLTGAGMSAESGIATFRDSNGLWENHRVEDVATPDGWRRNPKLVLDFYNQRRRQLATCKPNAGHLALAQLQEHFDTHIITQNVDDLHERAGSHNILHLHGQLTQARSSADENLIVDTGYNDIALGDKCPLGSQLRPNIVWFGEDVPNIAPAYALVEKADILVVIGTSLAVYPAAGLLNAARPGTPIYRIDPKAERQLPGVHLIPYGASEGVALLAQMLKKLA